MDSPLRDMENEMKKVGSYYECLDELKELVKHYSDQPVEVIIAKAFEAGYERRESDFDAETMEEAHRTEMGYCCACASDVSFMEQRIREAKTNQSK